MNERWPELRALTGLRFLAALLVVLHHFMRHFRPGVVPIGTIPFAVLYNGNVAVSFFFALSGFILAYSYLTPDGAFRKSFGAYARSRVARIYPVYVFALLLWLPSFLFSYSYFSPAHLGFTMFWSLLLLQNWPQAVHDSIGYAWGGPAWSLSVEAFFYAAFPLLALGLARVRTSALIAAWGVLYIGVVVATHVALSTQCGGSFAPAQCGDIIATLPLSRLPEFALGVILGVLFMRHRGICTALMRVPLELLITMAALLLAFAYVYPSPFSIPATFAPSWALIILAAAVQRGWATRLLSSSGALLLGEASYSLYLLHWPIWYWLTRLVGIPEFTPASSTSMLLGLCYVVLCVSLSVVCLQMIERPGRAAILRLGRAGRERMEDRRIETGAIGADQG